MGMRYFLLWLPMVAIAIINALLREKLIARYYSQFRSHQLSTITLIIFCSVYVWYILPYLEIETGRQALFIGLMWMLLTIVFEFSLGRLTKTPWNELLENYNLFRGYLWLVFLLCLMLMPYIFYLINRS